MVNDILNGSDRFQDFIMNTAEEIRLEFGFNTEINKNVILVDCPVIGFYHYKIGTDNYCHMEEFYRFCKCYGMKLSEYGLKNELKEKEICQKQQ